MSQRRELLEERLQNAEVRLESVEDIFYIPVLEVLLAFMLWNHAKG